jgi:hypothetical protein
LIVVAFTEIVKKTAGGAEEFPRRADLGAPRCRPKFFRRAPDFVLLDCRDASQPPANMVVPEAAGAVLEVRLKMKNGVVILPMPRAGHLCQIAKQVLMISRHQVRINVVVQPVKEFGITRQITAIQQCDVELEVLPVEPAALRQRVHAVSDPKSQVP